MWAIFIDQKFNLVKTVIVQVDLQIQHYQWQKLAI